MNEAAIVVDGFTDVEKIGEGGIGDVYRATRRSSGTTVAIKELRSDHEHATTERRVTRELTALASLRGHPHVVQLEEVVRTASGRLALVMEHCPEGSLDDRSAASGGMLPLAEVILATTHGAAALEAAHDSGIIHRDVKPQNLLVGAYGQVKVCDFGVSSISSSEQFANRTSAVTYRYASPEELRGDATITSATDVYSLAVCAAKLLTNRYFNHETAVHLADPSVTPGAAGPTPSPVEIELRRLLHGCLAHRAADRPSAAEVHAALDGLSMRLGDDRLQRLAPIRGDRGAARAVTPTPASRPLIDRRRRAAWALAIVLWLVAAVLAIVYVAGAPQGESGAPADQLSFSVQSRRSSVTSISIRADTPGENSLPTASATI